MNICADLRKHDSSLHHCRDILWYDIVTILHSQCDIIAIFNVLQYTKNCSNHKIMESVCYKSIRWGQVGNYMQSMCDTWLTITRVLLSTQTEILILLLNLCSVTFLLNRSLLKLTQPDGNMLAICVRL